MSAIMRFLSLNKRPSEDFLKFVHVVSLHQMSLSELQSIRLQVENNFSHKSLDYVDYAIKKLAREYFEPRKDFDMLMNFTLNRPTNSRSILLGIQHYTLYDERIACIYDPEHCAWLSVPNFKPFTSRMKRAFVHDSWLYLMDAIYCYRFNLDDGHGEFFGLPDNVYCDNSQFIDDDLFLYVRENKDGRPMNICKLHVLSATAKGFLYVLGEICNGLENVAFGSTVMEFYDPSNDQWKTCANFSTGKKIFTIFASNDNIYCASYDFENTLEIYDHNKSEWSDYPFSIPHDVYPQNLLVLGSTIIFYGCTSNSLMRVITYSMDLNIGQIVKLPETDIKFTSIVCLTADFKEIEKVKRILYRNNAVVQYRHT
ncbi:hypothetical protein ACOME3_005251 [Neoechinorhynchus agilis]